MAFGEILLAGYSRKSRAGKMEPSLALGTTRCIPQAKLPRKPYNKSKCEVKMAGWLLFCEFMDLDFVSVPKHTKKELGQYPVILTEQTWSIRDLLYGFRGNFSCRIQRVVPSGQDDSILPARVTNHIARFGSSCPLAELAI